MEVMQRFIREHAEDDLSELLLNASRYREVDVKAAVVQIKARRKMKDKLPEWYKDERLIFPSTLAVEQCSSEITAGYKQRLVLCNDVLCDLTGGLGVDAYYLSQKVQHVTIIEKNKACCDAVRANFNTLGVTNVHIINGDAIDFLKNRKERIDSVNVFFADPSRRSTGNKRLFAIHDCQPDLLKICCSLPACYKLIVKLSPMLELTQVLTLIPYISEVHIVSVKNECKELLVISKREAADSMIPSVIADPTTPRVIVGEQMIPRVNTDPTIPCIIANDPMIYCVNYLTDGSEQSFCFRMKEERAAVAPVAKFVGRFLYEPNASILEAGAYKRVAWQFGVEKLQINTHLYTSAHPVISFPGRLFEIVEVMPFNNRLCKTIRLTVPKANMAVRNFPLSVDELRKRTRINDGGDIYLYATTLPDNQKVLIKCCKFQPSIRTPVM
jgi:hypothetical protein